MTEVDPRIRYELKVDRSQGPDACHPWLGNITKYGYGRMRLVGGSRARNCGNIHRWAYEEFIAPISTTQVVRHTCDNRACQNPKHWLLGTQAENVADAKDRERMPRGERHHNARLKTTDVLEIRKSSLDAKVLSQLYGISSRHVRDIKALRRWTWL